MSTTTDAVDQVFKVTLDGVVYTLRLAEIVLPAATNVLRSAFRGVRGVITGDRKTEGEVSVASMLRRGTGLSYFLIRDADYENFINVAKETSLLYSCAGYVKAQETGEVVREIMVPQDQVTLLNQIVQLAGINTIQAGAIEQVTAEPETNREAAPGVARTPEQQQEYDREQDRAFFNSFHKAQEDREAQRGKEKEEFTANPPKAVRAQKEQTQEQGDPQSENTSSMHEPPSKQNKSSKQQEEVVAREESDRPQKATVHRRPSVKAQVKEISEKKNYDPDRAAKDFAEKVAKETKDITH